MPFFSLTPISLFSFLYPPNFFLTSVLRVTPNATADALSRMSFRPSQLFCFQCHFFKPTHGRFLLFSSSCPLLFFKAHLDYLRLIHISQLMQLAIWPQARISGREMSLLDGRHIRKLS